MKPGVWMWAHPTKRERRAPRVVSRRGGQAARQRRYEGRPACRFKEAAAVYAVGCSEIVLHGSESS